MNMKTLTAALFFVLSFSIYAFSPYENYLQSGLPTHVMLMSSASEGKADALSSSLIALKSDKEICEEFKSKGITNISIFFRTLEGESCFFVYFDYSGKKDYLQAVQDFESVGAVEKIDKLIKPVPPALDRGYHWLQLEWINYIHGSMSKAPAKSISANVTRIKPECEKEYRWLHQTTWPGIVDWMNRYGWRNFSIYLVALNGTIYEFYYTETVESQHPAKDIGKDPTLLRWLKHTDPCQNPLPDAKGVWAPMKLLN